MAKLLVVYSTLASSVTYAARKVGANGAHIEQEGVTIKGGAGVANEHLITPQGVPTMVSESQLELLKTDPVFKLHQQNGFVKVAEVDRPVRPSDDAAIEKAVSGMEARDNSAPPTENDFTATGQKPPSVDAPKS